MKNKLCFLMIFLFWSLSFVLLSFEANQTISKTDFNDYLLILPERVRSVLAASIWERADKLMHKGPLFDDQNFYAGSYAGNTDIIPLLKMVIALCPNETAPYRLLADNYAYHLNLKTKAVELLENGIIKCSDNVNVHELYASEALVYLFTKESEKDLDRAGYLLDKAIDCFRIDEKYPDAVMNVCNYWVIRSRIFWEKNEPEQALLAWEKSGNDLYSSKDRLALLLINYKQKGVVEALNSFENLGLSKSLDSNADIIDEHEQKLCKHQSNDFDDHALKEKNPLKSIIWSLISAGFLACFGFILYFVCSKSYGIVPCVSRFFPGN